MCGWYNKAVDYINNTNISVAFVSTNSICQGESVGILWKHLFSKGIFINFAYRSFIWNSEALDKAHVHCVIVGFSRIGKTQKLLFGDSYIYRPRNINGYLISAENIFLEARGKPQNKTLSEMIKGSQPTDGGNLILSEAEKIELENKYSRTFNFIKPYIGAEEFINNKKRYCLWLKGVDPKNYKNIPEIIKRLDNVRIMRLSSPTKSVRECADIPSLFTQIRQPTEGNYLLVPRVTSERRKYIPLGFLSYENIASDAVQMITNATLYDFGILTSIVHNAWMRVVAGRLKSDYRYSPSVYNNFIWIDTTEQQKEQINKTAQAILDARALYPDWSLGDLYDPLTMPLELLKAHKANDKAVMSLYGFEPDASEEEMVAKLMQMYAEKVKLRE